MTTMPAPDPPELLDPAQRQLPNVSLPPRPYAKLFILLRVFCGVAACVSVFVGCLLILWGCWVLWQESSNAFYRGGDLVGLASYTSGVVAGSVLVGAGLISLTHLCTSNY